MDTPNEIEKRAVKIILASWLIASILILIS